MWGRVRVRIFFFGSNKNFFLVRAKFYKSLPLTRILIFWIIMFKFKPFFKFLTKYWLIHHWSIDWLIDRSLIDWLIDRSLIDWLIDRSLIDWLIDRSLIHWLIDRSITDHEVCAAMSFYFNLQLYRYSVINLPSKCK